MSDFYGDATRWFIGRVEDNDDPLQLGRVRVRVNGIHSGSQLDIDTSDLPWSQVLLPGTIPGISGHSETVQLQRGALVFGFFLDGKSSQLPLIVGSIPTIEYGSPLQRQNQPDARLNRSVNPQSTAPGTGITGERNTTQPETGEAFGASGTSNPEKAYNFFITQGFTPNQSAGIVGNLMQESGPSMSTTVKSAGSEKSFGIAQWNSSAAAGNRLGLLKEFANDLGRDWTDLDVQLRFIIYELENFRYLGLSQIKSATTVRDAVIAFETKYERPSDSQRSNRIKYAKDILKRMNS